MNHTFKNICITMCFLPVANYFDVGRIKFGMSLPNLLMNKYLANYGKLLV